MQESSEILGYTFRDPNLLRLALTHPSAGPRNNQRLEFLGDAILEYLISERLFRELPNAQEGELTRRRLQLVCEEAQSAIAKAHGIGARLIMNHGEEHTGGREKPSVLCDAMEAILAAIYLDGGMEAARETVTRLWPRTEDTVLPLTGAKNELQEVLQGRGESFPEYKLLGRTGPDHAPVFTVAVFHNGEILATASGSSKKAAEQEAALRALGKIREGK
ncbi:MAG: ribonuclease III [Clostridia bacterium]|nr:ribonuclease III [Clostridia bacterium]